VTLMTVRTMMSLVSLLFSAACFATPITLFEQQPDLDDNRGFVSTTSGKQQTADEFSLTASAAPNLLTWWGYGGAVDDPNPALDFLVRLYRDTEGLPEDEPFFEQAVLGAGGTFYGTSWMSMDDSRIDIYGYSAAVAMPTLEADATYWLSVVGLSNFIWGNSEGGPGTRVAFSTTDTSPWNSYEDTNRAAQAFRLEYVSVPEPGALQLALVAFVISLVVRRRSVRLIGTHTDTHKSA
jgi:hypothetical protein